MTKGKYCFTMDLELLNTFRDKCRETGLVCGKVIENLVHEWLKLSGEIIKANIKEAVSMFEDRKQGEVKNGPEGDGSQNI